MNAIFSQRMPSLKTVHLVALSLSLCIFSCKQQSVDTDLGTNNPADTVRPDDNRFTPVTLTTEGALDEPMNFEVVKDGRVFINERKGVLKVFNPIDKTVNVAETIPVNTKYTSRDGKVTEEGFIGFTVDPKFEDNHFAYQKHHKIHYHA